MLEVVIIGGGLMGSATAWQLSNQGTKVLLLEEQGATYTQGSSFGEARIARSSNIEGDFWSYLHNRSVAETQALINFLKAAAPKNTFKLEDIYTTSPVSYIDGIEMQDELLASLKRQKIDYDFITSPEEGAEKFGIELPQNVALRREYNLQSGSLNPKKLISYLHKAIKLKGNDIAYNARVIGINYNTQKRLYEISTLNKISGKAEAVLCQKVVSAVGPYTGDLLKVIAPYFQKLIHPKRVFLAFFKIREEVYNRLSEKVKDKLKVFFPLINHASEKPEARVFAMIESYSKNMHPVFKVGGHFQRSAITEIDKVWHVEISKEEIEWSKKSLSDYFGILNLPVAIEDLELVQGYSCVYSLTTSEIPLVTPIPHKNNTPNNNFIVIGGMSGVGAKGAMTYGLIAADLLNGNTQTDALHSIATSKLGFERLMHDIQN